MQIRGATKLLHYVFAPADRWVLQIEKQVFRAQMRHAHHHPQFGVQTAILQHGAHAPGAGDITDGRRIEGKHA